MGPGDGPVVLLGMMGAGKTTTAAALAVRSGRTVLDSDEELERRTGATGVELAERAGVDVLHEIEARILLEALVRGGATVVTAAASVVDSDVCRAALRTAQLVVWLEAPIEVLVRRGSTGRHRRPVTEAALDAAIDARAARFAAAAHLRLDATWSTDELVDAIVARLA